MVELAEAGVITNAKKTLKPGKFVVTFLMGTKRLYDFVNNNRKGTILDTVPLAAVAGKAMMDTPPLDADAPRTKSTWPPAPEICFRPTD